MKLIHGPLTERQRDFLRQLAEGRRQVDIAKDLNVVPQVVCGDIRIATYRLGAATSTQAVAIWTRAKALRDVAEELRQARVAIPIDDVEYHLNKVLSDLAALLESRARHLDTVITLEYKAVDR